MRFILKYLIILTISLSAWSQTNGGASVQKPKMKHGSLKPKKSINLDPTIKEGSGLAIWNGKLWTHNDSGKPQLFALDTANGKLADTYDLPRIKNRDWEEISQDHDFFYIGDFGNNAYKADTLKIFRVDKKSLLQKKPVIDSIVFTWPETQNRGVQTKLNFDCEAMVVVGDSICLFTKEWKQGRRSRLFTIPKRPGQWLARYKTTLETRLLVTGASYDEQSEKLVLCGYNLTLQPYLLVFPKTSGQDFFSQPGRKIRVRKRFRQVEGIATANGTDYFLINEDFNFPLLHTKAQLHRITIATD
ncbi:T9SS C-terminal target domain-containing protein [Flavobacterium sp.]|uniref:T9SS C-terminal target domain-containing protein n=1 Tax=Flavobacterium sp. TaxID=239 RepID=UPI002620B1AB|nr:T9SS C-terminal target domain-containing protein [Flavobacterium sp.]